MYLFAVQSFPQQHISSHPSRPLDKKVAYLKAIWQTDCCTMQLLNARVTKTTLFYVGLLYISIVTQIILLSFFVLFFKMNYYCLLL